MSSSNNGTYRQLILTTGNLMHTNVTGILNSAFKRTHEEVLAGFRNTLHANTAANVNSSSDSSSNSSSIDYDTTSDRLIVEHPQSLSSTKCCSDTDSIDDLQLTAKLFLFPQKDQSTAESAKHQMDMAIQSLKKRTGLTQINNFTLAFTDFKLDDDAEEEEEEDNTITTVSWPDMTYYHHLWKALEEEHSQGGVKELGVSEFTRNRLDTFLSTITIPPASNQVNLADCCIMPRELIAYCRERGIELVTHSDASDLFSTKELQQLLKQFPSVHGYTPADASSISLQWLLKFSVMVQSRGIICDKGYILFATSK
ncbi:hypothetical protein BDF22DRAFT_455716 [Syncephalis plumigaleata]|nr:hypothetical protein BDF22DRAFT_455716 [Syncephalis plumigaleata]